ncbi:DUF3465 domain-containing protein [Acinetobacter sp. S40]|uniref:DUF3465 domain-containing protein n=1 Tax=Acinetobacter sp. S40 TaxID=2767434 RepID=UPI00190AF4E2|nr:DUF3465 domain-containing protein [Acinetobacter sp. S40]MBJ9984645.1 DUF3465 domain-containing protein [Acinetobacter sp. S40]
MNKKLSYLLIALIAFVAGYYTYSVKTPHSSLKTDNVSHEMQNQIVLGQSQTDLTQAQKGLQAISTAFAQHRSNVQVVASGKVKAILPDDKDGSRHQKFILSLGNGLTVLVAHNIDLASRIEHLEKGDLVEFNGEYEYNPKGGVIHWTHRDPKGNHEDGWLKHNGKIYQ